jgi:hypothetical protein
MRQQHEWKMEFIGDIGRRKLCQGLVIQITGDVVRLVPLAIVPESTAYSEVIHVPDFALSPSAQICSYLTFHIYPEII